MESVKYKINKKSFNIAIIFILLCISEMLFSRSYLDEVLGLISFIYVGINIICKKNDKNDAKIYFIMIMTIVSGIISNYLSGLVSSNFSIIVDIISEFKVMSVFLAFKISVNEKEKNDFVRILLPFAKFFIIISFSFGILTLFFNTGMYVSERFGIPSYHFIFPTVYQFATIEMASIYIVLKNNIIKSRKELNKYIVIGLISILLTTKGPQIIFCVGFVFLSLYLKNREKLKVSTLIFMGIITMLLGLYQINNYLLKEDTPRNVFYKYSFITANDYFPLGSGFATFGSDMAARDYSKLYIKYGFNNMWGMDKKEGWFLSDNFWPTPIAQLGWIFGILYIYMYFVPIFSIHKKIKNSYEKAYIYAMIAQYYIHAVGSAILSSGSGVIGFLIIGIALSNIKED